MANNSKSESCRRVIVLGIACLFIVNGAVLADETVFDVMNYDAKADGKTDDAPAVIQAWRAACTSKGPARFVVPANKEFTVGPVILVGPCTAPPPIIVDIQGNLSAISDLSLYANGVWIKVDEVDGVELTGGGTLNAHGLDVWKYADGENPLPVSMILQSVSNTKVRNLTFVDSMGFHMKVTDSRDVVLENLTILAPGKSPNTDGIHLSNTSNVNITDSTIGTGDDCVSVGSGSINVLITRVICGPGHGLSIGSLGKREEDMSVSGITVINCTINGTTNGARIKTYHASPQITATNIIFQDLVMTQVKNPIIIDQHYDSKKRPQQSSVKISDAKFINIKGTSTSPVAVRLNCSSTFPCENIELKDIDLVPFNAKTPSLTSACSNAKFTLGGNINPTVSTSCT